MCRYNMNMNNILPVTANMMLSDRKFDKWVANRWSRLTAFMRGENTEIVPCMFGTFCYNGKVYQMTSTGISE